MRVVFVVCKYHITKSCMTEQGLRCKCSWVHIGWLVISLCNACRIYGDTGIFSRAQSEMGCQGVGHYHTITASEDGINWHFASWHLSQHQQDQYPTEAEYSVHRECMGVADVLKQFSKPCLH